MIAAGAALLLPASAAATDRYVDFGAGGSAPCTDPANPCTTIAEALGPAVDGDVIHLAPGHYVEAVSTEVNVTLIGAAPVLRGESFDSNLHTVIQSAGGPAPSLELKGGGTVRDLTAVGFTGPGSHSPAIVLANPPGGPGASTVRLQGVRAVGGKATEGLPALRVWMSPPRRGTRSRCSSKTAPSKPRRTASRHRQKAKTSS